MTGSGDNGSVVVRNDPVRFLDNPSLYTLQKPFPLEKSDFMVIKISNASDTYNSLSRLVLAPTVWLLFTVFAKLIKYYFWAGASVDPWEPILLVLGIAGYSTLRFKSKKVPNERKELLEEIEKHFKENKSRIGTID